MVNFDSLDFVDVMKNNIIRSAGGVVIKETQKGFSLALLNKNNEWVLPKGRMEKEESEKETALREIHEELGIPYQELKISTRLGDLCYTAHQPVDNYIARPKIVTYFLVKTQYNKIRPLKTEGFENASWFSLEEAFKRATFSESKGIILKAMHQSEKRKQNIDTAIIAAGGEGRRMNFPSGKEFSKLLVPVHGKPFLSFLLDATLQVEFKKIYLLTGHYEEEIKEFVQTFYRNKLGTIHIISGGTEGVVTAISKAKKLIKSPFIYMDGNVICPPNLLKRLMLSKSFPKSIIKLAVSPRDLAPTHLWLSIERNVIKDTYPRMIPDSNPNGLTEKFCSMGIMAIDNRIFDLLSDFNSYYDLDLIIDFLLKTRPDIDIGILKYYGNWYCIHEKKDLELIERKGKNFFRSLTNQ